MTKQWVKDAVERVVRTVLQAYLGAWVAISDHDFGDFVSHGVVLTAVSAGVITLLTCLGAAKVNSPDTASFQSPPPG